MPTRTGYAHHNYLIGHNTSPDRNKTNPSPNRPHAAEPTRKALVTRESVLVTSNSSFAAAAWAYGEKYLASRHVSTVISDFSLANMAWLKTPVEAADVPITQILAFSYAALRPPDVLWQKYLAEIDRLQEDGTISQQQHILLRSHELASRELVHLTLGEDAALKQETIKAAVDRVTGQFTKEADERLRKERERHQDTLEALKAERNRGQRTKEKVCRWSRNLAGVVSYTISGLIVITLVCGMIGGLLLQSTAPEIGWALSISSGLVMLGSLLSLVFNSSVKDLHVWLRDKCSSWLFKLIARAISIDARDSGRS